MQTITYADYLDADNNMVGQCTACHARQGGCEPDARNYKCESCGALQVYGLEELAMMGGIAVVDVPPIRDNNAYAVTDRKLQPFCGDSKLRDINSPFWFDGRLWATDGRIAVRYAAKSPPPDTGQPAHVPRMYEMPWKEDTQCNHQWPTSKQLRGDQENAQIGGRCIAIKYARKVARLGHVYYCPSGGSCDALAFATETIEGLLMPMTKQ